MPQKTPLVLMILDGWGFSEKKEHNAIFSAHTPQWDAWWKTCPHVLLEASGPSVGLPDGQMGNSEVGHMHIGAGRMVPQDLTRINLAISNGEYAKNPVFLDAIEDVKRRGKALHILGLLSPGGVHSHEDHLFAFLALCAQLNFSNVYLHLFLDGRDTSPQSALTSLAKLQEQLIQHPIATIASVTGRYYAMDRDTRWQRIEPVYQMLTNPSKTGLFTTAQDAILSFYQQGIFDEFIPPTLIGVSCAIQDDDTVLFFNFRADRARQLTQAFIVRDFHGFNRQRTLTLNRFISMTPYSDDLPTCSAFPTAPLHNTLGEVLSNHGLRQLRVAETEKYAHVTFFLNGGSEHIFPNETRRLINSPNVATYDLQPEM
ncbi:MAG TPA: 2,3-bisphosphoglycerate-independent phosphoglycerate mutase, partial [Legionella sp.]|nr:2,3-bisphosphoglycerate-independent phosphoglycerate mutase [Legionella sp.]